ncbi:hypothetical protein DM860_015664 [Cuscuta australis]|uniref:NB-ARC domain-containing protein n=1 Tax=Cuscuta australis TaxID=267555 RepID=A0A328DFM3_9ASTE|nr:hypothetical protein DM860_015664 [Cuscuta australis]
MDGIGTLVLDGGHDVKLFWIRDLQSVLYEAEDFLDELSLQISKAEESRIPVVVIVGMGGVAKITIAKLVYNDKSIAPLFDSHVWISVSGENSIQTITRLVVESACGVHCELNEFDLLQRKLQKILKEKKLVLVFDEFWNEDTIDWETFMLPFIDALPGTKILVTMRSTIASRLIATSPVYCAKGLSVENCWKINRQKYS